jgi:hypothetical protein
MVCFVSSFTFLASLLLICFSVPVMPSKHDHFDVSFNQRIEELKATMTAIKASTHTKVSAARNRGLESTLTATDHIHEYTDAFRQYAGLNATLLSDTLTGASGSISMRKAFAAAAAAAAKAEEIARKAAAKSSKYHTFSSGSVTGNLNVDSLNAKLERHGVKDTVVSEIVSMSTQHFSLEAITAHIQKHFPDKSKSTINDIVLTAHLSAGVLPPKPMATAKSNNDALTQKVRKASIERETFLAHQ